MNRTRVHFVGSDIYINGRPTYEGRHWRGNRIEGQLITMRMVNAIFDDLNPETRGRWAYPDSGQWDPERNVSEFIAMLPEYRRHGVLGFTVNLQGGSPEGYCDIQPWINTAFTAYGALRESYLARLTRVLDAAEELGMVVLVGLFYHLQDTRLVDEKAIINAVSNAVGWLLDQQYENVVVEISNECGIGLWDANESSPARERVPNFDPQFMKTRYSHAILSPDRIHELILLARSIMRDGKNCLVGTSYRSGMIPSEAVVDASDIVLLHGNGMPDPAGIACKVDLVRKLANYRGIPVLFNEDDTTNFDVTPNNFMTAIEQHASWGFYDPGEGAGGFHAHSNYKDGFQNVPVNWTINTKRKVEFFSLTSEITGSSYPPRALQAASSTST